jgi:hypothetical protein
MSMSWTEQIDTFRTTASAPSTVSKHCFKWKEVGSDPTSTGTEVELNPPRRKPKLEPKTKKRKVPDQASTGTEIKNEIPAGPLLENVSEEKVAITQEEWDKFRWGHPISTKYLVREMKPIAWPFQASTSCLAFSSLWPCQASRTWTSSPKTSLKPEDRVLCSSKFGGPDGKELVSSSSAGEAKQWLGECEIISTISGNSGGYRVKWLWHENTDFDINSKHTIDEQDIRYVLVKNGTCLHQDPKWRSALEIVVRSPLYPPSSRPPPSSLSSPGRKMY